MKPGNKFSFLIPETIISDAFHNKTIRSLSHFIVFKTYYHSGDIHTPKLSKIGALLGISPSNASYHLAIWLKEGWVQYKYKRNGKKYLSIINLNKVANIKHKSTVTITNEDTHLSIKAKLAAKIVELKLRQSNYQIELKSQQRNLEANPKSYASVKTIKKLRKVRHVERLTEELVFTNKKMAKYLNISESGYAPIKKAMRHFKIIDYIAPQVQLFKVEFNWFMQHKEEYKKLYGAIFFKSGFLYLQKPTEYMAVQYPLKYRLPKR